MTEQERDELLLSIVETQREHGEKLDNVKATVDAVSDGLQDLRRDLEDHAVLPPAEAAG